MNLNNHYVKELANHANELKKVLDTNGAYEKRHKEIKSVSHYIYLLKNKLDQEKVSADISSAWKEVENRMRRSQRLINWEASETAIQQEVNWLNLMIDQLAFILSELEPVLIANEKNKWELQAEKQLETAGK